MWLIVRNCVLNERKRTKEISGIWDDEFRQLRRECDWELLRSRRDYCKLIMVSRDIRTPDAAILSSLKSRWVLAAREEFRQRRDVFTRWQPLSFRQPKRTAILVHAPFSIFNFFLYLYLLFFLFFVFAFFFSSIFSCFLGIFFHFAFFFTFFYVLFISYLQPFCLFFCFFFFCFCFFPRFHFF